MAQHFKVHELLDRAELDQLEAFAREPGRTAIECHDWMLSRGYRISDSAVEGWLRHFRMEDRYRASGELAKSLVDTAKQQGVVAISDATALQMQSMIFQKALDVQSTNDMSTKDLLGLSLAFKTVVSGKRGVEQLKKEVADAIATAEQQAAAGKSAVDVVSVIKQSLGLV